MTFFDFDKNDIIHTQVVTNPHWNVSYAGSSVTGSVYLERPYLNQALAQRQMYGFSERLGGLTSMYQGITASVDFKSANVQGTNRQLYGAVQNLYGFHSLESSRYVNGVQVPNVRVITIPQVYYDRGVQTGSFKASDTDVSGNQRFLYDDGFGAIIYSGSQTVAGNIFYSEGIVVLTSSNLQDFGQASTSSLKWNVTFNGDRTIPVNIYKCRAPAGQLNASTNPTFYTIPASGTYKNTRQVVSSSVVPYITSIGLYNEDYELVGVARLAQPIRKEYSWDIAFNVKMDW